MDVCLLPGNIGNLFFRTERSAVAYPFTQSVLWMDHWCIELMSNELTQERVAKDVMNETRICLKLIRLHNPLWRQNYYDIKTLFGKMKADVHITNHSYLSSIRRRKMCQLSNASLHDKLAQYVHSPWFLHLYFHLKCIIKYFSIQKNHFNISKKSYPQRKPHANE